MYFKRKFLGNNVKTEPELKLAMSLNILLIQNEYIEIYISIRVCTEKKNIQ